MFGHLVVLKKDGTSGGVFDITKNLIVIGRDIKSDIRIKNSAVSREHVKIIVDQNGHVSISL